MIVVTFVLAIFFLTFILYLKSIYNEHYWKKRGVVFNKRNRVLGPFWEFMTMDRPLFQIFQDIYNKYNDPIIGLGSLIVPSLYIKDLDCMNHILQVDYHSFNHRGVEANDRDILGNNVVFLHGAKWKLVRQSLSPLFTTSKLKNMYYIMDKSAKDFVEYLKNNPSKCDGGAHDTLTEYCSAALSATVFGITTESIFESPFLEMVKSALKPTFWYNLKFTLGNIWTPFYKITGLKIFGNHERFLITAIKSVLRQREKLNLKRHDFADLAVSLQRNGTLRDSESGFELEPTDELLAGQAFFFFLAGLDPCAASMFNTLMELGRNPRMLQQLHEEIDDTFEKHNELSYDIISKMAYLEKFLNETLRMYPPIGYLPRQCVSDSELPIGNLKVEKGTKIFLPVYEVHHDPKYFPDPEVFDPERFADNHLANDSAYMPFGKGSRLCIGARYAKMQVKTGLVHVLRHFTVKTYIHEEGIKFKKDQIQVRLSNVDFKLHPRYVNKL